MEEIDANLVNDMANVMYWGFEVDPESGQILNYEEIVTAMVEKYNAGEISDEEYEDFKNDLSKYDETLNLSKEKWSSYLEE
jgi:hypothetical protein